jgi:hypothetical protein
MQRNAQQQLDKALAALLDSFVPNIRKRQLRMNFMQLNLKCENRRSRASLFSGSKVKKSASCAINQSQNSFSLVI